MSTTATSLDQNEASTVVSNGEKADTNVKNDIPDGGTLAWMQVAGGFFLFFNSWGIVNTFGAYQTYYEIDLLRSKSPSAISWIGSIQAFLLLMVGVLAGPIFDMGYFRALVVSGSVLLVFGMMMTSLATEYYQVFLAQGIIVGLAGGCLFVPSVAIVATYFDKKRAFATGLAACGSSIGGVIYPIIFHDLQPKIGFAWATRVIGFIAMATCILSVSIMKPRVMPKSRRSLFDFAALRETPLLFFAAASFIGFMAVYVPFFYLPVYSIGKANASENFAFYFLPILNAASTPGRVLPNFFADKTGPLNMLIPCTLFSAILALCWIRIENIPGLIVFAILYGFFTGTFVSLPPATVASLSPDLRKVGTHMGMVFGIASLGVLVGLPLAGLLLNIQSVQYVHAQIFGGILLAFSGLLMAFARIAKVGTVIRAKA